MNSMFDIIKKQNGENFAKAIRAYDSGIFDILGLDKIVEFAGADAEPIMQYLISLKGVKIPEKLSNENSFELLYRAGYNAVYADTLKKQNEILKYFKDGEKLCTFKNETRYESYYIINAVKHDVDKIKRENFLNPERQDEYGTSVISIQILKTGGFIKITNRYNHAVPNSDNTFDSNPDNIIYGLSAILKHEYNVDFSAQKTALPGNYIEVQKQVVKFNYENSNIWFGNNFYVHDGIINKINPDFEIVLDYFTLNLRDKKVSNISDKKDSFQDILEKIVKTGKVQIKNNGKNGRILLVNGVELLTTQDGKITSLTLPAGLTSIGDNFLTRCKGLTSLNLPAGITRVGDVFLSGCNGLKSLNLPAGITHVGQWFLYDCTGLKSLTLPAGITSVGQWFLSDCTGLTSLKLPDGLTHVGDGFLAGCSNLKKIEISQETYDRLKNDINFKAGTKGKQIIFIDESKKNVPDNVPDVAKESLLKRFKNNIINQYFGPGNGKSR